VRRPPSAVRVSEPRDAAGREKRQKKAPKDRSSAGAERYELKVRGPEKQPKVKRTRL